MEQIAENEKTPKETIPVIKVFIPFISDSGCGCHTARLNFSSKGNFPSFGT
jgi:hypothetical protein